MQILLFAYFAYGDENDLVFSISRQNLSCRNSLFCVMPDKFRMMFIPVPSTIRQISCKRQERVICLEYLGSTPFCGFHFSHLYGFLCCTKMYYDVGFVCFRPVSSEHNFGQCPLRFSPTFIQDTIGVIKS